MPRLFQLLKRFRRDEGGAFMVLFAVLAIVLIATSGAVVDFTKIEQTRTRAQTALDAAALALQTRISTETNDQLKSDAQAILNERLNDDTVTATVDIVTTSARDGLLNIQASVTVPMAFVQLVGIRTVQAHLESEVTRSSKDVEVAVSLDVTGSMVATYDKKGKLLTNKIGDLITATDTLIDLVVKDSQTPTYSKMAIIPWSASVNVGSSKITDIRGTLDATTKTITNAVWSTGSAVNISAISRVNNGVVTANGHGLSTGDTVYITGVKGMTSVNNLSYTITKVDNNNFKLNVSTSDNNKYTSAGTVTKCKYSDCRYTITTLTSHGYANNQPVHIEGVSGATGLNAKGFFSSDVTSTTMSLLGSFPTMGTYSTPNNGKLYCGSYGCTYRTFYTAAGNNSINSFKAINNCVTDRTTNAYKDTPPSTTKLGIDYAASCDSVQMIPLTSDKDDLHDLVDDLTATGSTAGHLGLAWGWYMISPNFGYLWPAASRPAAYNASNLIKAVVFMTDGVFNTPYCSGVVANDALDGAGSTSAHIDCASPNGSSRAQAQQLCDAIKNPDDPVLLYTVGFDLADDSDSRDFLEDCATGPAYFFRADNGNDLEDAFEAIGKSLSNLRLSK